jgi:hypothetical protein
MKYEEKEVIQTEGGNGRRNCYLLAVDPLGTSQSNDCMTLSVGLSRARHSQIGFQK